MNWSIIVWEEKGNSAPEINMFWYFHDNVSFILDFTFSYVVFRKNKCCLRLVLFSSLSHSLYVIIWMGWYCSLRGILLGLWNESERQLSILHVYVDWQITGQAGIQWKLLLESRTSELFKIDLEVSDLGYDQIDGRHLPVLSITAITGVFLIMSKPINAYLHVTRSTDIILKSDI